VCRIALWFAAVGVHPNPYSDLMYFTAVELCWLAAECPSRVQDAQLIATLRAQLDDREKRITVLEGAKAMNPRPVPRDGVAGGLGARGGGSILPARLRGQR
jgi:hypothetical protein